MTKRFFGSCFLMLPILVMSSCGQQAEPRVSQLHEGAYSETLDKGFGLPNLSRNQKALLATISWAEGTNQRYDYTYCHQTFDSYDAHPLPRKEDAISCWGIRSTASGRYQIMNFTWKRCKEALSLKSFSPLRQDACALWLIWKDGGVSEEEVNGVTTYEQFQSMIRKLNGIWASLPESPYGQGTKSWHELYAQFVHYTVVYRDY